VTDFFTHHGLPLLFVVVMLESFGIPLPGETALIAFGVLASQGNYDIAVVIAVAAAAAIIGDNLGYWIIGRGLGRRLVRHPRFKERADRYLPRAEEIIQRHGGKAVFFGRFVAILRFTVAWIAGLGRMPWWRFFFWNAAGGIVWATSVGLLAYWGGKAVAEAVARYGALGAVAAVALFGLGWFGLYRARKRLEEKL
jgi:membrane protein DedA with SNARE-associated domain